MLRQKVKREEVKQEREKKMKGTVRYYVCLILSVWFIVFGIMVMTQALNRPEVSYWRLVGGIIYLILGAVLTFSGIKAFRKHRKGVINQPTFHYLCSIMPMALIVQAANCIVNNLREPKVCVSCIIILTVNILLAAVISILSISTLREYIRITK